MGGRWEVHTHNTNHVWDLNAMTYTRRPGPRSGPMPHDNVEVAIGRVDAWPAVGARSLVWFDDPDDRPARECPDRRRPAAPGHMFRFNV